jgi:FKBP-type peptidyl-prolyl cis-trans isomerase FkpA
MKLTRCLLYICLISLSLSYSTSDEDFVKTFNVKHFSKGDSTQQPNPGDDVWVDYRGTLADGTQFDSSYDRGQPIKFVLKVGQVIPCWDQAVSRMALNEKIKVTCPAATAYGENGMGSMIPKNADLTFVMELKQIRSSGNKLFNF